MTEPEEFDEPQTSEKQARQAKWDQKWAHAQDLIRDCEANG